MNDIFKKALIYFSTFLGLVIVGYLALVIAYCIPTTANTPISNNMTNSAQQFTSEDKYELLMSRQNSQMDNVTDSLMLLIASYDKNTNPFIDSLNNNFYYNKKDVKDTLTDIYVNKNYENITVSNYARYWHGYLIFLKPLLCLTDYYSIRYFIMGLEITLLVWLIIALTKRNKAFIAISYTLAFLFMNPVNCMMNLQFATCIIITLSFSLFLIYFHNKIKHIPLLFMIVGCITCYFDLYTYPIIVFGIPFALLTLLNNPPTLSIFIKNLIFCCLAFAVSFLLFWSSKWMLSNLITGNNLINEALQQFSKRSSTMSPYTNLQEANSFAEYITSYMYTIKTLLLISHNPFLFAISILLIILTICILFKSRSLDKKILIELITISMLPFFYVLFTINHTSVHCFFTYRILTLSIFAIYLFCFAIVNNFLHLKFNTKPSKTTSANKILL